MLNIGPQELLLVLLIALIVVGPARLPALGQGLGKALRELRKAQDDLRRTVQQGLDTPAGEVLRPLKETADEIRRAGRDVSSGFRTQSARTQAARAAPRTKTYPLHRTPPSGPPAAPSAPGSPVADTEAHPSAGDTAPTSAPDDETGA